MRMCWKYTILIMVLVASAAVVLSQCAPKIVQAHDWGLRYRSTTAGGTDLHDPNPRFVPVSIPDSTRQRITAAASAELAKVPGHFDTTRFEVFQILSDGADYMIVFVRKQVPVVVIDGGSPVVVLDCKTLRFRGSVLMQ